MDDVSRREFLNRVATIGGIWPLVDKASLSEVSTSDQEWCLQQELGVREALTRLASVKSIYRLDDGPRSGLQQEILIAPPSLLASKPDRIDEMPLGMAWAIERLGREFGRDFYKKYAEAFSRILWEFFGHRRVRIAWIERNLLSIPDWLLHCLVSRVKFSEGAMRRERSGPPEQIASESIRFGSGADSLAIRLNGIRLGHLPGARRRLRFYRQSIPREYCGPGLRRQEYVESRFLIMEVDEHVRQRMGEIDCHIIPAEQPSLSKTQLNGKQVDVWNMRFITLGQIRDDGMCAMLGLGFRPDDAELVSIRPCFLPFSVTAISIPGLIPMLNKAVTAS